MAPCLEKELGPRVVIKSVPKRNKNVIHISRGLGQPGDGASGTAQAKGAGPQHLMQVRKHERNTSSQQRSLHTVHRGHRPHCDGGSARAACRRCASAVAGGRAGQGTAEHDRLAVHETQAGAAGHTLEVGAWHPWGGVSPHRATGASGSLSVWLVTCHMPHTCRPRPAPSGRHGMRVGGWAAQRQPTMQQGRLHPGTSAGSSHVHVEEGSPH